MQILFSAILSMSMWSQTKPKTLTELPIHELYAANQSRSVIAPKGQVSNAAQTQFTYEFLKLLTVAKQNDVSLQSWFREDHFIYFSDYLSEQEKVAAVGVFKQIQQQISAGSRDIRSILMSVTSPLLVARMGQMDSEVLRIKDQHKDVIRLAIAKHEKENQQLYGDKNYSYHLRQVRAVLKRFGFGPKDSVFGLKVGTAAWLHDIVEDTDVTVEQIKELFGDEVATMVLGVTKLEIPGLKGEEKLRKTYERTRQNRGSRILKLADRIANVEEGLMLLFTGQASKVHKYFGEWVLFKEIIYVPGEADLMWRHLELLLTDQAYAQDFILRSIRDGEGVRPTSVCEVLLN